jgi:hypothetical protein
MGAALAVKPSVLNEEEISSVTAILHGRITGTIHPLWKNSTDRMRFPNKRFL